MGSRRARKGENDKDSRQDLCYNYLVNHPNPPQFWNLRFRHAAGVVHRDIGGEHLLVPVKGRLVDLRAIFSLNPIAADIWARLDGCRELSAIRDELLAEYDVPEDVLESDVREILARLADSGLIEVVP